MGMIKSRVKEIKDEYEWGKHQYPTLFPFNNELIKSCCIHYQLSAEEITKLYQYFCMADTNNIGYVFFNDLCSFIEEVEDSMAIPYLETLFELIPKKYPDRLNFLEWY
jgi:Ca2+-binding EF-hand superfamily protein